MRRVYQVLLALQRIYGRSDGGGENGNGEERRLPGLLYADELEEDLRVMVGCFAEVLEKEYESQCKEMV